MFFFRKEQCPHSLFRHVPVKGTRLAGLHREPVGDAPSLHALVPQLVTCCFLVPRDHQSCLFFNCFMFWIWPPTLIDLLKQLVARLSILELLVWFLLVQRNNPRSEMPPGPRVSKHQADHSNVEGDVHDDGDSYAQQRLFIFLHSRLWPARNALWKWTVEFDLLKIFAAWAQLSPELCSWWLLSRCRVWCRHVHNWGIFRRIPEIGAAILGQGSYGVVSWPRGSRLIRVAYTSSHRVSESAIRQTVCPHWRLGRIRVKAGAWSGCSIWGAAFSL